MPIDDNQSAISVASEGSPCVDHPSIGPSHDSFDIHQHHLVAHHPPPGASVYPPSAPFSGALNPRSCVTCRRRKVRCDKHMPCSNCRRAQIPCIFPAPGRAPRRPRPKDPNAPSKQPSSERELELMKRLRKLEGIVEELSGQIELEAVRHPFSSSNSPEGTGGHDADGHATGATRAGDKPGTPNGSNLGKNSPSTGTGMGTDKSGAQGLQTQLNRPPFGPLRRISSDIHKQFGRLVLNEKGVTRYVSSGFWSAINDELDEIRRETIECGQHDSDVSDDEASPESVDQPVSHSDHQSFIFGYRSADVDLRPLHPLPSQIPFMWQVFQENVDPILKVLHVPSMTKTIRHARNNMDSLTPSTEALMFAIYYSAVASMDKDEAKMNFGAEKDYLVQQYRFALEQALARANFTTTPDITLAQAFLLFLILVRRQDDTRFAWTLTGLLIRISQALGLHRDGTNFPNISPFEVEMRRRIFWAVCILDLRSAEDQGTDLTLVDRTFDTQLPLNVNDSDISPDMKDFPESRDGPTDMTFSLIRYEICTVARRLHTASSAMAPVCPGDAATSLEEREEMLADLHKRVEEKYLRDRSCLDNPMYWVAANIARVLVAKMTLIIYQPVLFPGPDNEELSDELRERLFNSAIEVFETNHILNTDPRTKPWRWLFQTYTQWPAVAYLLIEVSHKAWGPASERAWGALNSVYTAPKEYELEKLASHTAVWLPIKKMYFKAKRHREAETARLRANPQAAMQLELEDQSRPAPTTFGALSVTEEISITVARERWRKLVNAPPLPVEPVPPPRQPTPEIPQTVQQQTNEVHTNDNSHPTENMNVSKPEMMDFLDPTMTNQGFNPQEFIPLWRGPPFDPSRPPVYGFSNGDIPRMDSAANFNPATIPDFNRSTTPAPTGGNQLHHTPGPGPNMNTAQGMQVQSPVKDENAPWLWPGPGLPEMLRVPNFQVEDMDVNMDEGFDWQNWQESLGRFEMETNGGSTATSTWGPAI
ncbi:hypothetical protein NEUTE1DRAFT_92483 [Neurospora tetrasperma FGSC 2508]|uniref:Zn(2)-C6 fungal-type domain-containing protein n=1 Tax=Neurospora tetrasperma (strain FGSC 2508 / ATCC MYA-4615 / P0657) TaxID=510951 RepID=F8N2D6_NEUT8|nr:uncharacterized protein NEUTE1DRAFT_92483 [Neurospora tetrasperma FGSC 2508]EGO53307.1 hypothetical protein NEUTE1DRAFT_92483 [Neurospora tetrasperma FGSC 2508]